ncbi:MAG TPA: family 43 glycosylhydrolase [Solirubrobacteraceae bacterium]
MGAQPGALRAGHRAVVSSREHSSPQLHRPILRAVGLLLLAGLLWLGLFSAAAHAQPIRDGRHLLSCPDPSVVRAHVGRYHYYLVCTSDYARDAFPIRGSNNLTSWHQVGSVFPAKHQPWWALPSPAGRFWAPSIYRIQKRWVVYFAAQFNPAAVHLRIPHAGPVAPKTLVIGVAISRSLSGPWRSHILHYRGQFNGVSADQETYGGDIDPSVVRDAANGQLFLFWAEQPRSIWAGQLSASGWTLSPDIRQVLQASPGWECDTPRGKCVVEGPEEYYRHGRVYLFYSGASTWTGTYAVGVASSANPLLDPFTALSTVPALRSGHGWIGPGGSSAPVIGPDGRTYIFYHAMHGPNNAHVSANRYLFVSPVSWEGPDDSYPLIGSGYPG